MLCDEKKISSLVIMLKELELWMFKTLTGLFLLEPVLPVEVHPITQPGPHPCGAPGCQPLCSNA